MRILILVRSIPPHCGGGEQVAWNHAIGLARTDEVHILTFGSDDDFLHEKGVHVHFLPMRKHPIRYYLTIGKKEIIALKERIDPDVIHEHMPGIFGYVLRNEKCLKVETFHQSWTNDEMKKGIVSITKELKRKQIWNSIIKKYDVLTTVSKWQAQVCSQQYERDVKFIPNGVDTTTFTQKDGIHRKSNSILYVGRIISERKGVDKLHQAAKEMPKYEFYFIGKGPYLSSLIGANIHALGFVSNEELVKHYHTTSLCVFPSQWENWPLTGLEAMACGAPIISTERGFSEYITHNQDGYIIPDNDPETVKNAIRILMGDDELRKSLSINARKTAEMYDWNRIIPKYKVLYEECLPN